MRRTTWMVAALVCAMCATGFAEEANSDVQPALVKQIAEYNRLLEEKRLPEAAAMAKAIQTQYPKNPIVKLLQEHTQLLQALSERSTDADVSRKYRELVSMVYSVADILTPTPQKEDAPAAEITEADYRPLIELIEKTVAPMSWDHMNGPGSMRPYLSTQSLVIRQTSAAHDEISGLLSHLRELRRATVAFEVRFVEGMSSATYALDRQNPVKLKQNELETLLKTESTRGKPNWSEQGVTTIKVVNGETGSIETPVTADAAPVKIQIMPTLGGDWRRLRLKIADERAPDNAVSVQISSDECIAVSLNRLAEPLPKTPLEAVLREARLKAAPGTVVIITPTIEHH